MKKILLVLSMFLFMTNVKALTFNVDLTNIEDKGNNGTIGSITNIDISNKTIDAYFQDIGDEVNFDLTISNTGDRAGTLKSITVGSTSESIEYTNNLPETGLAINGNDSNTVTITAKVKEGAVNGTSSSEITIKYNYDEGSCPEGETLSDDESMCLCPEEYERNENGICVKPEKETITCKDDEIYNETKKICEKKVTPTPDKKITPSNPKTMDNIVLITLLFFVSGLGIYAVLYKKLQTKKKKIVSALIVGIITLGSSFTVLAGIFGLDNLLSAIVNPITKSKEIVVTVNEEIDLIETWDGNCDLEVADLTPSNIFNGGSGTESDPYKIKTAEQLSCFAKSVNNGTTYEGQYIKQTKNIKLNDKLIDNITAGTTAGLHVWISAGDYRLDPAPYFAGTYDGDNHIISGLYITNDSVSPYQYSSYPGLFGYAKSVTFKNLTLSDVYANTTKSAGALAGMVENNLVVENVTTYGQIFASNYTAGLVSSFEGKGIGSVKFENVENNININTSGSASGIIHYIREVNGEIEPNIVLKNVTNNGTITLTSGSLQGGLGGYFSTNNSGKLVVENCANNGDFVFVDGFRTSATGGIIGEFNGVSANLKDSYNTGNWVDAETSQSGGLFGNLYNATVIADNLYNSGNLTYSEVHPEGLTENVSANMYVGGIFGYSNGTMTITNCYNTGDMSGNIAYGAGIIGHGYGTIENCYNTGTLTAASYTGGLVGDFSGTINKSYNKGNIILYKSVRAGGLVGWGGSRIYNSYNEGDILITSRGGQHGGLCACDCGEIKNSYNRGNITSKYYGVQIGGITGQGGTISNVYNSGNITYENLEQRNGMMLAGISSTSDATNSYNLGNITAYITGDRPSTYPDIHLDGVVNHANAYNSVNTGNVSLIITQPFTVKNLIEMNGVAYFGATNSFNAGTVSIDDSALDTPIRQDGLNHTIYLGEVSFQSGSGNKFNSNPNGHAAGCFGLKDSCTSEFDLTVGTYTTEEAPDILSIINGDDAFEIKEGETLPTLKVFNE